MTDSVLSRVPMVAGVAYLERVRRLPASFTATLAAEADNRYFRHAIAVLFEGEKVGYVAPEVAAGVFDSINGASAPVACPARRAMPIDHETSGVEILLDFSGLSLAAAE
ncbi:MAG: hypothetical protein ABIS06_21560 [Vicinamibacterales bacterium]